MKQNKQKTWIRLSIFLGLGLCTSAFLFKANNPESSDIEKLASNLENREFISKQIGSHVLKNQLPERINLPLQGENVPSKIQYTLDPHVQKEAERLLKTYKPDYAAVVMMDAETGRILAMTSYQKDSPTAENWALKASFPAASVFKVVTATAAVDKAGIEPDHQIKYNGGAYTLYKKNVMTDKVTRWTNTITLRDAFARSINTAFGRLSFEELTPKDIHEYAGKFMFNRPLPTDFPVEVGHASVPVDKTFAFAEVVSGYNKMNKMSPVQGAMIAASVANDGQVIAPYLVDQIETDSGQLLYKAEPLNSGVSMKKESAEKVREMMERTVIAGTSRKSFRSMVRDRKYKEIEMGGKTGHLTGDSPRGRTDWFVGYAFDGENKVAIAAVTVSKKFWTIKSSVLSQTLFKKYFTPIVKDRMVSSTR